MTTETASPSGVDQVLLAALEAGKRAGDFAIEQAPDLIQQLLMYNIVATSIIALISLTVFGLSARWVYYGIKALRADKYASENYYMPAFICGGLAMVPTGVLLLTCVLELIKLLLAPKIWLLEYTASLIR